MNQEQLSLPPVLDVTCGARMMWFDKQNPSALFVDNREVQPTVVGDMNFSVHPDMIADFTELPFDNDQFYLVVFDPPHLVRVGDNSHMAIKYGKLTDWETTLEAGFTECMRVLKPGGTLIFKWSEIQIPVSKIIQVIGTQPLFGHRSGRKSRTHWLAFLKPLNDTEGIEI